MATRNRQQCRATDLGVLQNEAIAAARVLKGARTALANAQQAVQKAEEAHATAQRALTVGMEAVKVETRVG